MTSRSPFLSFVLAGLLTGSPAASAPERAGAWALDVDGGSIGLAAEDASVREIVLAIVERFDLRLVEHETISGTVTLSLADESLHAVLGRLLAAHSFQLYAVDESAAGGGTGIPNTLWVFASGAARAPAATAFLEAVVYRGSRAEKRAAIRELERLGGPAAVQALGIALSDDDRQIRELALESLEAVGGAEAMGTIASAAADPDPRLRSAAAEALSSGDRRSAVQYLSLALRDPDPRVRRSAVEGLADAPLGAVPSADVVDVLRQALADENVEVRMAAVDALEDVGGGVAYDALLAAKADRDERVADAAAESLQSLKP